MGYDFLFYSISVIITLTVSALSRNSTPEFILAQKATEFRNIGALCKIEKKEALKIFEMAYV